MADQYLTSISNAAAAAVCVCVRARVCVCVDISPYVTGPAKIDHVSTNYTKLYFC